MTICADRVQIFTRANSSRLTPRAICPRSPADMEIEKISISFKNGPKKKKKKDLESLKLGLSDGKITLFFFSKIQDIDEGFFWGGNTTRIPLMGRA
jgi:hypothetical protein